MNANAFKKFIERFIPPNFTGDGLELSKHKLFIGTCFITALFAFFYGIMSFFIHYELGYTLMASAVVIFIIMPLFLKLGIGLTLLSNILIAIIGIIYMALTCTSGGISKGPMDHWVLLLPMLALMLLDLKQALIWLGACIGISIAFFYVDFAGIKLPAHYESYFFDMFNMLSFIGIIVILFIVNNIFATAKFDALKSLDNKNHELNDTLTKLRATQDSLIESEKLASLGQLTAGIAHEIRNPLNFVTNFSTLSEEMIQEAKKEKNERVRMETMDDIAKNLQKISLHSKRAENIVRGMLQHSFKGKMEKELSDINLICHDVSNFAYHAIHSTIPGFKCKLNRNFGSDLPLINVVQNEISRVILNLLNNSFFALHEKRLTIAAEEDTNFTPEITITTLRAGHFIEIAVKDNGDGISDTIKDKIFTPFFTTKSFGEGTGLGLSISYGIITKGHGGTLSMSSQKHQGTTFTILLPISDDAIS